MESKSTFGSRMLGNFTGMRIILDDDLPPDVCEFCNRDGKVLYAVTLEVQSPR